MKGWYDSNKHILYVFDTPAEIPYVDASAEAIAVAPEYVDGFKKANTDYADIIVGYNFSSLTVHAKPFEGHTNDDIVSPKTDPDLAWSADAATVQIGETNAFPTLTNTDSVTVTYESSATAVATIDANGDITLLTAGTTNISAVFAGNDEYNAKTVTYVLTVNAAKVDPELYFQMEDPTTHDTYEVTSWACDWNPDPAVMSTTPPILVNTDGVTWTGSSTDDTICSISASGIISVCGANPGEESKTATLTVISTATSVYNSKTITLEVTVYNSEVPVDPTEPPTDAPTEEPI